MVFIWFPSLIASTELDLISINEKYEELKKNEIQDIEQWRKLGYLFKQESRFEEAIDCYNKIIEINKSDYDANLALGRLYLQNNQHPKAINIFRNILENDITDVEAYLGLARTYSALEDYSFSIENYDLALQYLPDYVPALFELAEIYSYHNQLDSAIETYKRILKIDNTYSEAYSGFGKMLWWKNKPYKAIKYYERALNWDPENLEIKNEMNKILKEFDINYSGSFLYGREQEDLYKISYFQHQYLLGKRISDLLFIQLNSTWHYAQKEENYFTTERYFDSSTIRASMMINQHRINFLIGGSLSDSTLTAAEFNWQIKHRFRSFILKNNIAVGHQYFYFWGKVSKQYLRNNFELKWGKMSLLSNYEIGKVLKNWIWYKYTKAENPYLNYKFALQYEILNSPKIIVGGNYKFMDYMYDSSLYYTPSDRKIYGISSSIYQSINKFYFYADGNIFKDNKNDYETSFNVELGYNFNIFSLSISFTKFKNDYYKNETVSLDIEGDF